MNLFEQAINQDLKCEICEGELIFLYGGGWDNDRIYCSDQECGSEYEFPTTTEAPIKTPA